MTESHSFSGTALFDAHRVRAMMSAFDAACRALPEQPTTDAHRAALARVITELCEGGETDADRLRDMALAHMGGAAQAAGGSEGSV